jgi:hypothetical protein
MLERVSAALAKFLTPLTTSINNGLGSSVSTSKPFLRAKKQKKESSSTDKKNKDNKSQLSPTSI